MKLKRLSLFLALVMILSAFAGTFTFASAATTAGGTFEIWREGAKVSEYTGTITAAITDAKIEDGDTVKLTSNYASIAVEQAGMTINLTVDGQGLYEISNKGTGSGGRLFNLGANSAVSNPITLTFQNITMTSVTASGMFQMNQQDQKLVFKNAVLNMNAAPSNGAVVMIHTGNTVEFYGTKANLNAPTSGVPRFVNVRTTSQNVLIDSSVCTVNSNASTSTTGAFIYFENATTGSVVTVQNNSIIDVSNSPKFRAIYTTGSNAGATLNFSNCLIKGAANTNDVMQVSTNVAVNVGNNVGFIGGGELLASTDLPSIIRNYNSNSMVYDNNNAVKVYNNTYASTLDFFVAMGATKLNGTNYDEVAASMGYKMRIGDAATAYNNGTFTGYYTSVAFALKDVAAGNTVTLIEDATWGSLHTVNKALTIDLNGYTLSSKGTYCRFANMEANLTIKNGTLDGIGGSGNLFQMQNTAKGIELTFEDVTIKMTHGSGTTSFIQPLGQNQVVNFKGNITVSDTSATHALVYLFGSNSTVNFIDGEFTVVGYSRVVYGDVNNHDGSGAIDGLKFNVTNSVLRTDAWGGVFQNSKGTATVTLKNADIMTPASNQFLRLSAGASATVNGETVTAEAETYYMPTSQMLTGASVRIARGATAENLTESGIRFESTLSADIVAAVGAMIEAGTIKNATVGTVVFKKADLGSKSVAQLVRDANADANDALIVADIEANNGIVENADGSATIRAAIINIKEKNYGVEFGAVAYIEYEMADGEIVRIYGNYNSTNHTRSIKAVAENALADTKTAAEIEANGSATFDGYNYYNEIAEGVFSCYSDEQIAILNTYAGK